MPGSRRRLNRIFGLGSLLLVLLSSTAIYWATLASQSSGPASAYPGWITVLQPIPVSTSVQVRILVDAGPKDDHQQMSYGVVACGTGNFSAYLLVGGASVLSHPSIDAGSDTVVEHLDSGQLTIRDAFASAFAQHESVQVFRFSFSNLPTCLGRVNDQEFGGVAFRVNGVASEAVSRVRHFGPFQGSTQTWSMPYVGNLPGAGHNIGEFDLDGVIVGSFMRPPALASDVDAGPVPLGMTMRDARPAISDVDRAVWHQSRPFQATVQVEDSSAVALAQRFSTVSSVVLGLAGAILTAYVFEFVRGGRVHYERQMGDTAPERRENEDRSGKERPGWYQRGWWTPVIVTVIATALYRRFVSRRPADE